MNFKLFGQSELLTYDTLAEKSVSNPLSMLTKIRGIEKQSCRNFELFGLIGVLTHDKLAVHKTQKIGYLILYQCLLE